MNVYDVMAEIIRPFEGLKLQAYVCPAGILTIGYGHTRDVTAGMTISAYQAEGLLKWDMKIALSAALKLSPTLVTETAGRQAAIADFIFNLGSGRYKASTLRTRVNAGNWAEVPYELRRWVNGGGRKLAGLIARREAEIAIL